MATPVIPTLTAEQRQAAHRASLQLRIRRAYVKRLLAAGNGTVQQMWYVDCVQGMKVLDLLTALPGIGMRRALALLQQAGIPSRNTVRACGVRQTEKLFVALAQLSHKPRD